MRHAVPIQFLFCRSVVMKKIFVRCSLFFILCHRAVAAEGPAANTVVVSPEFIATLAEEARTNHPALRAADLRADAATWNAAAVRAWEDQLRCHVRCATDYR